MFAGDGSGELSWYINDAKFVEMWELNYQNVLQLVNEYTDIRSNNKKVYNVNSLEKINTSLDKFDIVIIDAPANMDINPIIQNIYKIVNKKAYIIVRAIKQSWNNNPEILITANLEKLSNEFYNLKVVKMLEFEREFFYDKLWLANYFYYVQREN